MIIASFYVDITEEEMRDPLNLTHPSLIYAVQSPEQTEAITYTRQLDGSYIVNVPKEMKNQ